MRVRASICSPLPLSFFFFALLPPITRRTWAGYLVNWSAPAPSHLVNCEKRVGSLEKPIFDRRFRRGASNT